MQMSAYLERTELNGCPAVIARAPSGEIETVLLIEADAHAVHSIRIVRNPDKLGRL